MEVADHGEMALRLAQVRSYALVFMDMQKMLMNRKFNPMSAYSGERDR